jgi:MBG domain (YGX type)/Pentapeptide repeats (8 copies)/Fibronectin type III domain/Bacterial Ig domain
MVAETGIGYEEGHMKGRVPRILSFAAAMALALSTAASPIGSAPVRADPGLSISGNVVGNFGNLGGIAVDVCRVTDSWFVCQASTQTDDSGYFTAGGLAAASYTLHFGGNASYASGYYKATGPVSTDSYDVVYVEETSATLANIQMTPIFAIKGVVIGSAGHLGNITVNACSIETGLCGALGGLDDNGGFNLGQLPVGTYTLSFYDSSRTYESGFYTGSGFTRDRGAAEVIGVTDHDVLMPAIELEIGVSIRGAVTGSAGGLAGIEVQACSVPDNSCTYSFTDSAGNYTIGGLNPGDYVVRIHAHDPYYGGDYSSSGLVGYGFGTPVTAGADGITLNTIQLPLGSAISGSITNYAGHTGWTYVEAWRIDMLDVHLGSVDDGGHFMVTGLAPGTYTLHIVDTSGYFFPSYYSDSGVAVLDVSEATPITVPPDVSGLTVALPTTAPGRPTDVTAIAGDGSATVSWVAPNPGGSAITQYAVTGSDGYRYCVTTDATNCTISGLVNGTSYTFTVTATNRFATGPASDPSNAVTPMPVQRPQSISFGPLAPTVYGAAQDTLYGQASSGLPVSYAAGGACSTAAGILYVTAAGTCTVTASQAGDAHWLAAQSVSRTFSVAPAPLSVSAPSTARAYGAANPAFTPAYSGFVNGDTAASLTTQPTCTTTATPVSPVGTYPINCSGASSTNYAIAYIPGTLTIAIADRFVTPAKTTLNVAAPGFLALTNASDATVVISTPPAGKLTLGTGGAFTYTPKSNFVGIDSFAYRLNVGGSLSAPVAATIYVVGTGMVCTGCDLSGLGLSGAALGGANLKLANLSGSGLDHANLKGAILSGADLSNANLAYASLKGANLAGATLTNVDLTGADLTGANLTGVVWSNATCPDGSNSTNDGGTCIGHLGP